MAAADYTFPAEYTEASLRGSVANQGQVAGKHVVVVGGGGGGGGVRRRRGPACWSTPASPLVVDSHVRRAGSQSHDRPAAADQKTAVCD